MHHSMILREAKGKKCHILLPSSGCIFQRCSRILLFLPSNNIFSDASELVRMLLKFLVAALVASFSDALEIFGCCSSCIFRRCSKKFWLLLRLHLSAMLLKFLVVALATSFGDAPEFFGCCSGYIFRQCSEILNLVVVFR